jgi:hypothetical protein
MRSKLSSRGHALEMEDPGTARIRVDLESRGLDPDFSVAFAERLEALSKSLSPEAYEAALDAVALACDVAPKKRDARRPKELNELQRLMSGFVGELRKLEESLRILDAYVTRMRTETESAEGQTLH